MNQMEQRTVQIGPHALGNGGHTLIIAEAGVNHDGSLDRAIQLVDVAADAGADVVKFQMFRAADLVTTNAATAAYQRVGGDASQFEMLRRLELPDSAFEKIAAHCRARRIDFLATPFGTGDVERLVRLGVSAIKIASTDLNNAPLIESAAATGLPLIVSTGASHPSEITSAVEWFDGWGARDRLVLLHCISGYPAQLHAANLRAITTLHRQFGVPTGFSDHTESTAIAGWAVAAGACVLEKHFTIDRELPGPDHRMSLDPAQLRAFVAAARQAEVALGTGRLGMTDIESDVRTVARKSIVAATDIPADTPIAINMLAVKRPSGGIEPADIGQVVGRITRVTIAADTSITWDMLR